MYADLDTQPLTEISKMMEPGDVFVSAKERGGLPAIYQALLVGKPGLPFFKMAVERICEYAEAGYVPSALAHHESWQDFWARGLALTGGTLLQACFKTYVPHAPTSLPATLSTPLGRARFHTYLQSDYIVDGSGAELVKPCRKEGESYYEDLKRGAWPYTVKIPRVLYQTARTYELSPWEGQCQDAWRDLNPSWSYEFYDDARGEEFIKEHYDEEVVAAYRDLIPGAYKADLLRYCLLHKMGGAYADVNKFPGVPLEEIVRQAGGQSFVSCRDGVGENAVWQAFMICAPGLQFFREAIQEIVDASVLRLDGGIPGFDPKFSLTGPLLLGKHLRRRAGGDVPQPSELLIGPPSDP